jgi:hypothetical protein
MSRRRGPGEDGGGAEGGGAAAPVPPTVASVHCKFCHIELEVAYDARLFWRCSKCRKVCREATPIGL